MKKSAVIILMVALFGSSAFASGSSSCSMRAKGTLFSDSGSSSTSSATSTRTRGQK